MKSLSYLALATVLAVTGSAHAQIINIDFVARGAESTSSPNFVGQGPAGGGTVFNGLAANDSSGVSPFTAAGTGLLDSNGNATTVAATFTAGGADNQLGANEFGPINGGYLYDGFGSAVNNITFTISGLTALSIQNLYIVNDEFSDIGTPALTLTNSGGTEVSYTPVNNAGVFTTGTGVGGTGQGGNFGDTYEFENVTVSALGTITGSITENSTNGDGGGYILSGLTVAAAPEPSTYAMFLAGFALLGFIIRRKGALVG